MKNKVTTCGYFLKRLKDNGYYTYRIFNNYGQGDPRRWTIIVNPGVESVFITCFFNKDFYNDLMFEFNDGGAYFPKNFQLKTDSMEVIITHLINRKVLPKENINAKKN